LPRTTAGRVGPALHTPRAGLVWPGVPLAAEPAALHRPITRPCCPLDSSSYLVDAHAWQNLRVRATTLLLAASLVPPRARPALVASGRGFWGHRCPGAPFEAPESVDDQNRLLDAAEVADRLSVPGRGWGERAIGRRGRRAREPHARGTKSGTEEAGNGSAKHFGLEPAHLQKHVWTIPNPLIQAGSVFCDQVRSSQSGTKLYPPRRDPSPETGERRSDAKGRRAPWISLRGYLN
jgi:hypothetical protein